jgi:Uma2 family endonuclease
MSDSILEPILRSHLLPEHLEELNRVLASERERRRQFYDRISDDHKWEFINGELIMHSPPANRHSRVVMRLAKLLSTWCSARKLGQVTVEKTLCQFPRNDYEPDIVFFGLTKAALIQPNTLLHPVPDFIVEVLSASTQATDRGIKLQDYEGHGVKEYWIIDPEAESVEQFILAEGHYSPALRQTTGRISSMAIAGFDISIRAIFEDEANLAELRRLLE